MNYHLAVNDFYCQNKLVWLSCEMLYYKMLSQQHWMSLTSYHTTSMYGVLRMCAAMLCRRPFH